MTLFVFKGKIDTGSRVTEFEKTVEAETEKHATEKLYSILGSQHSIPRSKVELDEIERED